MNPTAKTTVILAIIALSDVPSRSRAQAPAALDPTFTNIAAMAMDPQGNLVVADERNTGESFIIRLNPATGEWMELGTVSGAPLFEDYLRDRPLGIHDITIASNGDILIAAARSAAGPEFYIFNYILRLGAGGVEVLYRSDEWERAGPQRIYSIVHTPEDRLFAAGEDDTVYEIGTVTGEPTLVFGPEPEGAEFSLNGFSDMEADESGNLYVCGEFRYSHFAPYSEYLEISRIDPAAGVRETLVEPVLSLPPDGELNPGLWTNRISLSRNRYLTVLDMAFDRRAVFEIDLETGRQTAVTDFTRTRGLGFLGPAEIVTAEDGVSYIADPQQGYHEAAGIVRVDPADGGMELIAGLDIDPAPRFRQLRAAEGLPDGSVLVLDRAPDTRNGFGALFRIDPVTRVRRVLSDRTRGVCARMAEPEELAADPQGRCFAFDRTYLNRPKMYEFDPDTGEVLAAHPMKEYRGGRAEAEPGGGLAMLTYGAKLEVDLIGLPGAESERIAELVKPTVRGSDNSSVWDGLFGLAVRKNGGILAHFSKLSVLFQIDPGQGEWGNLKGEDFGNPGLLKGVLAMDAGMNDELYVLRGSSEDTAVYEYEDTAVYELDLENHTARQITHEYSGLYDMTLLPNGNLVTISRDTVFHIDPETGAVDVIAGGNAGTLITPVEDWPAH